MVKQSHFKHDIMEKLQKRKISFREFLPILPEFKVDKSLCLTEATKSDPISLIISVNDDKMSTLSSKATLPVSFFKFVSMSLSTPRK